MRALQQFRCLFRDAQRIVNGKKWRWVAVWFSPQFAPVFAYRVSRFFYLLFGRAFPVVQTLWLPFGFLLRPYFGRCEIHYQADIGAGLLIPHPTLGLVISAHAVIGQNVTLMGGNCIGMKAAGQIVIGHYAVFGANASALGPLVLGNHVRVGMGAVVTHSYGDDQVLVGVPAKPLSHEEAAWIEQA